MKKLISLVLVAFAATTAYAADDCAARAAEKKLAGAAMDVLASEPGPASHPLFKHENFYCTPHMAWHSEESAQELKRKAAEETRRVLRGEAPMYQVNKF